MGEGRVLSLDEFATVTARLEAGAPKDRVLTEAELTADEWLAAQAMWLERMAKLAAKGRPQLHERFLERLEAQRELEEKRKAAPRPLQGDMPRPPEPVVSAVGRLRRAAHKPAASVGPKPGAPRAFPASAPVAAPPAARPATAMFAAIPSVAALPFAPVDTEPAPESRATDDAALPFRPPSHAPPAPSERPGARSPRAAPVDGALPFRSASSAPPAPRRPDDGALPFRNTRSEVPASPNGPSSIPAPPAGTRPAVSAPAVSTPAVSMPAVSMPAVSMPAVPTPAVSTPAVPTPAVPTPAVPTPAPSSSAGSEMPSGAARRASQGATMSLPAMSPADMAALPFANSAPTPRPAMSGQAGGLPFAPSSPTKAPAERPAGQGGLPFGPPGAAAERQANLAGAMPFSPVASTLATSDDASARPGEGHTSGSAPNMTVEQYAWLCAAIAKAPDHTEATLAWMKLTASDKEALDHHFEEVFRTDASARSRFFTAMAAHEKG